MDKMSAASHRMSVTSVRHKPSMMKGAQQKIELPKWTIYEWIVYNLDILVPEDKPNVMMVPTGSVLQQVKYTRQKWRWRVIKNPDANLPEYLVEHKEHGIYNVITDGSDTLFPIVDPQGKFLRRWDALSLILLIFTASATPYETAFIRETGEFEPDLLFLIDRCVDFVFLLDIWGSPTNWCCAIKNIEVFKIDQIVEIIKSFKS